MTKRIYLLLLMSFFLSLSSHADNLMQQYRFDTNSNVKSLVVATLGRDTIVENVRSGPVGVFLVDVTLADKTRETLYVLQDVKHIIRGVLYSPYITDKAQAHGSKYLEKKAEQNKGRMDILAQVANSSQKKGSFEIIEPFLDKDKLLAQTKKSIMPFNVGFNEVEHYQKLEDAEIVPYGNQDNYVYVYYDHYCGACIKLDNDIIKASDTTGVGIRFVPVSFLGGDDGEGKSTLVLMPPKKDRFKRKSLFMGTQKLPTLLAPEEQRREVFKSDAFIQAKKGYANNKGLFYSLPKPATPAFVFKTKTGVYTQVTTTPNKIKKIFESMIDSPMEQ